MPRTRPVAGLDAFTGAPIFVARPVRQYLEDASNPGFPARVLLHSLCNVVESVVRFMAIAASLDVIASAPGRKAPPWLARLAADNLNTPTLGKWLAMLRGLASENASPAFPELSSAYAAIAGLVPFGDGEKVSERTNFVTMRNAIVHGGGVPDALADALLELWTPRIEDVFGRLSWLVEIELWAREANGFSLLNGPDAQMQSSEPPGVIGTRLPVGGAALLRDGAALLLHPLGRHTPTRADGPAHAQLFARRAPAGILYTLFGAGDALQPVSGPDEAEELHRIFDLASVRRAGEARDFVETGYDEMLESEAAHFVGREHDRSVLFDAVGGTTVRGLAVITGTAGIGKSALVSKVATDLGAAFDERSEGRASDERLLAYKFLAGDRGCAPLPFLRWLIERVARLCGKKAEPLHSHGLHDLRQMALSLLAAAPFDRIVLVLDNVDEIARRHHAFIIDMISRLTRVDRLLILVATRPEAGLPEAFERMGGRNVFAEGLGGMSRTDLRIMLTELLPAISKPLIRQDLADAETSNAFIDAIAERADGLPLYVSLVVDSLLRGNAGLEQAMKPDWLPSEVTGFMRKITSEGPFSDKRKLTPTIGFLLALSREPLSADEIGAFLVRALSPAVAARMARERGIDPFVHRRRIADQVLSELGGLLRSGIGADGRQRYRLLHEQLVHHVLTSDDSAETLSETKELLLAAATDPGADEAAAYLYRNGIVHILQEAAPPEEGAAEAMRLLSDFAYQVGRLETLAASGGDAGLRDDWAMVVERTSAIDQNSQLWRNFWATDGVHFEPGEGRNAPCEFIERTLSYAPDSAIGKATDVYLAGRSQNGAGLSNQSSGLRS